VIKRGGKVTKRYGCRGGDARREVLGGERGSKSWEERGIGKCCGSRSK